MGSTSRRALTLLCDLVLANKPSLGVSRFHLENEGIESDDL